MNFTLFVTTWIATAAANAVILIFPFAQKWEYAMGVGLLSNALLLIIIIFILWRNHRLFKLVQDATKRYIELSEFVFNINDPEKEEDKRRENGKENQVSGLQK